MTWIFEPFVSLVYKQLGAAFQVQRRSELEQKMIDQQLVVFAAYPQRQPMTTYDVKE
ncbi:MAG TPA: hypothetical protein VFC63_00425 [Blastocatellia bacterium]|nr:hypothetical protein [Blastocatellia bacterium]